MANEKNTAVKGYKINFANNTITVNYTFKKASEEYGTAEYELLKNILADFPTMTIIVKSGREKRLHLNSKISHMKKCVPTLAF